MKKIIPIFSFVFHPIFFSIFATLFYCSYTKNYLVQQYFYLLLFQVVIITFLLPLTFFYLLRTFGKVNTIMLPDIEQRKIPLLLQLVLTIVLLQKGVTADKFIELHYFFVATCCGIVLLFLLLYQNIKASIHMFAISSLTFFIFGMAVHNQLNLVNWIALLFLISGFVAASRLYLKAHTASEIYIGYVLGLISQVALFYFWL